MKNRQKLNIYYSKNNLHVLQKSINYYNSPNSSIVQICTKQNYHIFKPQTLYQNSIIQIKQRDIYVGAKDMYNYKYQSKKNGNL